MSHPVTNVKHVSGPVTKEAPTVADTGKFSVLPGLSGHELHLSSLKKDTPWQETVPPSLVLIVQEWL
ncbi:hypothetical protein BDN71DRAFT_1448410 [Pleurotus eryngii]|uniref:Uncharacterized protein n=1 Tax=Pleurotus eryngii TaxID=5323 RepID=A0A9P5ZV26_PLEER|nr:hypothetical protein BDN71DRAFT_1448410 [Pleurotus eryngii]